MKTLRDEIAIAAMNAILSRAATAELEITDGYSVEECAQDAYIYADAMLHERALKNKRRRERLASKKIHQSGKDAPCPGR